MNKRSLITAMVLALASIPLSAEDIICGRDEVIRYATEIRISAKSTAESAAAATAESLLRSAPNKVQPEESAPSALGASTSIVDSAERPSWIALALASGLVSDGEDGSITVSISPFDWLSSQRPKGYFDDQLNYRRLEGARRITGSVTLGAQGIPLDQNGDGTAEPAEPAKSLGDSIGIEVQWRFWGSRDRRDINLDESSLRLASASGKDIRVAHREFIERLAAKHRSGDAPSFDNWLMATLPDQAIPESDCRNIAKRLANDSSFVHAEYADDAEFQKAMDEFNRRIDGAAVWSLALNYLDRKSYLGPDRTGIAIRGVKGFPDRNKQRFLDGGSFKFDLEYGKDDFENPTLKDMSSLKLGAQWVKPANALPEGSVYKYALTGEKYRNAPADVKSSVAKFEFALEVPLKEGMSVPFSLTWANRDELLQDNDEVIAHVGLSFNFDAFKSK